MYDLHIHTTFSDGSDDVKQIVRKVKENAVMYFSITDHDSIKANLEMKKHEAQLMDCGVIYITGVEFSCLFLKTYEIHILCYDFDCDDISITDLVEKAENLRLENFEKVFKSLYEIHNIVLPISKIESMKKINNVLGKSHIAKIISKEGYGENIAEIIDNYLDDFNIIDCKLDAKETIETIKHQCAISILAHPKRIMQEYNLDYNSLEKLIQNLKELGLDGMEVYNSSHTMQDINEFKKIAKKLNMYISGGSDYHGVNKPNINLLNLGENVKKNDLKDMNPLLLEMLN